MKTVVTGDGDREAATGAPAPGPALRHGALGSRRRDLYARLYAPVYRTLERLGWHLTRNHFYSPVPDSRHLPRGLWETPSALPGVDLGLERQAELLRTVVAPHRAEYDALAGLESAAAPGEFWYANEWFTGIDPAIAWSLVRHHRPRRVVEVGSGMSTRLLAQALRRNRDGGDPAADLVTIDPYASAAVRDASPPLTRLVPSPVQEVALATFTALGDGDILFVDSSHVLRTGSDVQFLLVEVVPRLRRGVLVHFHDVFLPYEYPREWLTERWRFWNEEHALALFLAFNDVFEVVWASQAMHRAHRDLLRANLGHYDPDAELGGGSLWIRRVRD